MIELNKIYTQRAENYLKMVPSDFIDLTVTSPPYDGLRSYNSEFNLRVIIPELLRATKPGGVCVWVVADQTKNFSESGSSFKQALHFINVGWCLYDTMIWRKTNYMPGHIERYADEFEYMFVFSKGKPKTFNPIKVPCKTAGQSQKWANRPHESKVWKKDGTVQNRITNSTKIKGNIWDFSTGKGGSTNDMIAFEHPAIFPEKLVRDHVYTWTNENDIVADIFSGSATTAKVSLMMDRNFTGCDISSEYVEIGDMRLSKYRNLKKHNLFS